MKFCENCRTKNRASAEFCSTCGSDLSDTKQSEVKAKSTIAKTILVWFGVAAVATAIAISAASILQSLPNDKTNTNSALSPTPSESPVAFLNKFGVPLRCDHPAISDVARNLLATQMGAALDMQTTAYGFADSQVDAQNLGLTMKEESDPSKYKHLDCDFSAGSDYSVYMSFDSVAAPRDWMSSADEQLLEFDGGAKLVMYYPSGGGYEYGGGSTWRIWVAEGYLGIDSWSANYAYNQTMPAREISNLISALNGKRE